MAFSFVLQIITQAKTYAIELCIRNIMEKKLPVQKNRYSNINESIIIYRRNITEQPTVKNLNETLKTIIN